MKTFHVWLENNAVDRPRYAGGGRHYYSRYIKVLIGNKVYNYQCQEKAYLDDLIKKLDSPKSWIAWKALKTLEKEADDFTVEER